MIDKAPMPRYSGRSTGRRPSQPNACLLILLPISRSSARRTNQAYPAQTAAFGAFVRGRTPFRVISVSHDSEAAVLLLSLDGEWMPALVTSVGQGLFLSDCDVTRQMAASRFSSKTAPPRVSWATIRIARCHDLSIVGQGCCYGSSSSTPALSRVRRRDRSLYLLGTTVPEM